MNNKYKTITFYFVAIIKTQVFSVPYFSAELLDRRCKPKPLEREQQYP